MSPLPAVSMNARVAELVARGSRIGAIAKCPVDAATGKPTPPGAGKHCDSVPGNTLIGGNGF